jgi:hypothetical protein
MADPVPLLEGPHVKLRAPHPDDLDARVALGRQPEIVRMFGGDLRRPTSLPRDVAASWLERLGRHPHAWIIEVDGRLLGEIRLDNVARIGAPASPSASTTRPYSVAGTAAKPCASCWPTPSRSWPCIG